MKASQLKNKAVVSMADGVQIGRVEDVLFDTAALRSLGADAVTVESATPTQAAADQAGAGNLLRSFNDLISLKAFNGEGAYLGEVRDVTVEQATGALTELEAHSGGVRGLGGTGVTIPASAIRGIGPELVTVDMPAPTGEERQS